MPRVTSPSTSGCNRLIARCLRLLSFGLLVYSPGTSLDCHWGMMPSTCGQKTLSIRGPILNFCLLCRHARLQRRVYPAQPPPLSFGLLSRNQLEKGNTSVIPYWFSKIGSLLRQCCSIVRISPGGPCSSPPLYACSLTLIMSVQPVPSIVPFRYASRTCRLSCRSRTFRCRRTSCDLCTPLSPWCSSRYSPLATSSHRIHPP